jgi:hypothetical protein
MFDESRDPEGPEELSPAERRAFDALPREATPPGSLEERTVARLRDQGLLPFPIEARRRADARNRRWWIPAAAAAAAVAVFASGLAVGQYLGMRGAATMVALGARSSAAEAALHVRRAGELYVAAVANLSNLRDTTDYQAREQARTFALAALGAAAEEVAHLAPDDPLAGAVLRALDQRRHNAGSDVPSRSVIWY